MRTFAAAVLAALAAAPVHDVHRLKFVASGATFSVGQNFRPDMPWPRVAVKRYTELIDYDTGAIQIDVVRDMGATMPRGGGVPFTGELHQIQGSDGHVAWNVPMPPDPAAGSFPAGPCTPPEAGGTPPVAAPAPDTVIKCTLMLWATPQGFAKAAEANHATRSGNRVTFTIAGRAMTGTFNARNQLERVTTSVEQSIVGDMPIEIGYSGYKDFDGVEFPTRIVQKEDGFPSLDLTVSAVSADPAESITPPTLSAPPPAEVKVQQVADGVFWLSGDTHHSLVVGMKDHIVLVDTPNGAERANAVIAKAKELIPGKPIRTIVAMHHHWDHLGGIRSAIEEGATIVSYETNRPLLERAAAAAHRPLKLQTVGAKGTLTDGTRVIRLYVMTNFDHTNDMLLVYLPREKVLAEADAYTPPMTPQTPLIAPKVPYAKALMDNIRRLNLDVATIVPFHGMRIVDLAEVERQALK